MRIPQIEEFIVTIISIEEPNGESVTKYVFLINMNKKQRFENMCNNTICKTVCISRRSILVRGAVKFNKHIRNNSHTHSLSLSHFHVSAYFFKYWTDRFHNSIPILYSNIVNTPFLYLYYWIIRRLQIQTSIDKALVDVAKVFTCTRISEYI